jgi:hypothetical protein
MLLHMIMVVALKATGDMLPVAGATSYELVISWENFTHQAYSNGQGFNIEDHTSRMGPNLCKSIVETDPIVGIPFAVRRQLRPL